MGHTCNISNQPVELQDFLSVSFQNVRSSKRTDEFHKVLLDEVLNINPDWAEYGWEFEYTLPEDGFGGTFDIDIAGFVEGELKVAILGKALNSNISKNVKNYANTSVGEAARLMYAPGLSLEKVLFISVLPRVAPRFSKSGEVTGYDDVVSSKERTKINRVLESQYGGLVEAIDVYFDIGNVRSLTDFSEICVQNLDAIYLGSPVLN